MLREVVAGAERDDSEGYSGRIDAVFVHFGHHPHDGPISSADNGYNSSVLLAGLPQLAEGAWSFGD